MKILPKLALAAALATGMGSVVLTAPLSAQKKKEEAAGGLKLSPEALKAAQAAQPVLQQKNYAAAEPLVAAVETAAKTTRPAPTARRTASCRCAASAAADAWRPARGRLR